MSKYKTKPLNWYQVFCPACGMRWMFDKYLPSLTCLCDNVIERPSKYGKVLFTNDKRKEDGKKIQNSTNQ